MGGKKMKIQSIEPLSYQLLHETQYRMYTTAQQQITLYVIFEGKVNFSFSQEDVIVEENQGLFLAGGTQFTLMMYGEHIDGVKTVFSFAKGSELSLIHILMTNTTQLPAITALCLSHWQFWPYLQVQL